MQRIRISQFRKVPDVRGHKTAAEAVRQQHHGGGQITSLRAFDNGRAEDIPNVGAHDDGCQPDRTQETRYPVPLAPQPARTGDVAVIALNEQPRFDLTCAAETMCGKGAVDTTGKAENAARCRRWLVFDDADLDGDLLVAVLPANSTCLLVH